jgi:anti-sigma regulatory factor (Ser/Thr protein kinase)
MQRDDALEEYGTAAARFRRNLVVAAVVAVVAVVAVSAGLALRQYREAQRASLSNLGSRAVVAAGVVNASFAGDVATLQAMAVAPFFTPRELPRMTAYLHRVNRQNGGLFNGGMGWIDTTGIVRISTTSQRTPPTDVSDRAYFQRVLATGRPYVSGGLIGRTIGAPVIVVAVPTRDPGGRISGVLVGSVRLASVRTKRSALDLGYEGLEIVDRNGKELLSGLAPVENPALLKQMRRSPAGVVTRMHGLNGRGNHVVAFASAQVPAWYVVVDRPRSAVDAAALHSFVLQLVSVGAVALVVFFMVTFVVIRSRREHRLREGRARAWTDLTRALAAAVTTAEVTDAVSESLQLAFPGAMVVVVIDEIGGDRKTQAANPQSWRLVVGNAQVMNEIAALATSPPRQSVALAHEPSLRVIVTSSGRRLRHLHSLPMYDADRRVIGGIALLCRSDELLDPTEWALFESIVLQAAQAFERSRRATHDHGVALRLQRSLLPEALPDVPGMLLAGHYRAGSEGLEVGGDWYDAVRRRDGVVLLCVGDVIGRGVVAAMLMGRLRDAFRAHAYESSSPAEIVRRMRRHVMDEDVMITLACIALDPYSGTISYSTAGHPPPLLLDDAGTVIRLEGASAPPLGVADIASIREESREIDGAATVVLYTDGLVERRGQSIDHGIDVLGEVVADDPLKPIDRTIAQVADRLGAGTDDVAFLVVRITGEPVAFDVELLAGPGELSAFRRRLLAWLERRSVAGGEADEIVLAVSEACNNAIEHGYRGGAGSVWVRVEDDGTTLRATVRDRGRWREGPSGDDRGRGIAIMEALMDTATIERTAQGTEVVLERRRRGASAPLRAERTVR